jgi:alkylation response protein AidB-like acyl-CoA dehydrogenase
MDFGWDNEELTFRDSVRSFLQANWQGGDIEEEGDEQGAWERLRVYQKEMAAQGWLTMAWPKEYGGLAASFMEQMIFAEESALVGAPGGQGLVGPTLMIHGSEEQKTEHLPKIARAETVWAQGYSEPGSGSDLASLQTRAVRDGDEFVINGQKIWTSGAHHADWIHVLTRTDPDAPKHRGISYFMAPMDTPGITVRPLEQMHGAHGFNETFFEDVRVPAKNMIGEENRGWYVATTTLDFERSGVGRAAAVAMALGELLGGLEAGLEGSSAELNGPQRHAISEWKMEAEVGRIIGYRVAWMQSQSRVPNYEASMSKVFNTESTQRGARRAINILGLHGALKPQSEHAVLNGRFCQLYMSSVSRTIAAGSSEIQRNVIATRGLGLPRG